MQFRTQRGNLITLCERKTRFSAAAPLKTKTASETGATLQAILGALPAEARRTISFDNGPEFALHQDLTTTLGTEAFFRDPHSPWRRGTQENRHLQLQRPGRRRSHLGHQLNPEKVPRLPHPSRSLPR